MGQRNPAAASSFNCIDIGSGNDNAGVKNNSFLGQTEYGINQKSNSGSFKQNDFTNFTANQFDYRLEGNDNEIKDIGSSTLEDLGTGNIMKN